MHFNVKEEKEKYVISSSLGFAKIEACNVCDKSDFCQNKLKIKGMCEDFEFDIIKADKMRKFYDIDETLNFKEENK